MLKTLRCLLVSVAFTAALATPTLAETLGPSTNNNIGSDPSTLNALQPATPSALQSADSQSGGINQPTSGNSLQPAGTKSDFPTSLDIDSSVDGSPHSLAAAPANHINQIILAMIGLFMLFCAYFMFRISKLLETKNISRPDQNEAEYDTVQELNSDTSQIDQTEQTADALTEQNSPTEPLETTVEDQIVGSTLDTEPAIKTKRSTKKKSGSKGSRRKKMK